MKQDIVHDIFARNSGKNCTAGDILALFLKEQKKELLSKKNNMTVAVYEYLFMTHIKGEKDVVTLELPSAKLTFFQQRKLFLFRITIP